MKLGEKDLAKKYLDWAVYCRSDAAGPFVGLGDYYASLNEVDAARHNYELALQKDPSHDLATRNSPLRALVRKKIDRLPRAEK